MRKIFITLLILIALMGICYAQTKSISPSGENVVTKDADGNVVITGNIAGATYGSDSSISDAELLTLCNHVTVGYGKLVGINETGDAITITTAGTYYQYITEDEVVVENIVNDSTNHALQIVTTGHYLLLASATVSANAADRTIHIGIGKNGSVGTYNQLSYTSKFADRESSVTVTTIGTYLLVMI